MSAGLASVLSLTNSARAHHKSQSGKMSFCNYVTIQDSDVRWRMSLFDVCSDVNRLDVEFE